jgi:hypothetical protein
MELPEHFEDRDICTVLCNEDTRRLQKYPLTCGLAMKLRTGLVRVIKRSVLKSAERRLLSTEDVNLYNLIEAFTSEPEFLREHWPSAPTLHSVIVEVAIKAINLSPPLHRELCLHPLGVPTHIPATAETSARTSAVELNGITYDVSGQNQTSQGRIAVQFNKDFLRRVRQYHEETRRPAGTFDSPVKSAAATVAETPDTPQQPETALDRTILQLANLPKETCPQCRGSRQVYCGDCSGLRMVEADKFLPARVELPFDVLLLLHWQETLHKCTGVHVGVLCTKGTFATAAWSKELVPSSSTANSTGKPSVVTPGSAGGGDNLSNSRNGELAVPPPPALRESWKNLVESLDHTRDVLLFPCDGAENAQDFPWVEKVEQKQGADGAVGVSSSASDVADGDGTGAIVHSGREQTDRSNKSARWRLVVLEASWNYGKGMAQQVRTHRASVGLPPLRCVQLTDITGQYWKFQTMGHSAVSTIEAIAHTAGAAGSTAETVETLLLLFQLQKFRVLKRIEDGGKAPRAVEVSGAGLGCWKEFTDCLDDA